MRAIAPSFPDTLPRNVIASALLGIAVIGVAFGTVQSPWLVAGAVLGACVLAIALTAPLALIAAMLVLGPVDLSFLTGGFKALFPEMGGLDMNGIRLLGATAGFVAYTMFEPRSRAAAAGPQGRLWLVFLAYAGATIAVSADPLEGMRLLLKLAYPFLTFLIVIGVADSRERLHVLMRYTLAAAAAYTLFINPVLAFQGGYRVDADGFVRVGGLGTGDNPFAFYLTVILLVGFTRMLVRRKPWYLAFCVILTIWIALTVTRIAVPAAVAGLLLIGTLAAVRAKNTRILLVAFLVAGLTAAVLAPNMVARSLGFVPTPGELWTLIRNPGALYNAINWQGRQLLWAILWVAFLASPLLGHGLGSSTAILRETFPDQNVQVAHNEYLRLATDLGVLGLALFAAAVLTWLITVLRLCGRGDETVREYALPGAAAIVACSIIAITDNPIDYYTPFTQYIGLLVAGAIVAGNDGQSSAERAF